MPSTSTEIRVLAHNIRSLWNVGSFFRTCDAFSVSKLYLSGYTAQPPRREISKTALGAEENIAWEYHEDPKVYIEQCRQEGLTIIALEKTNTSTELSTFILQKPCLLILGHEVLGVSEELLDLCDEVVHIPMLGKKESLNVSVATGIALHQLRCC